MAQPNEEPMMTSLYRERTEGPQPRVFDDLPPKTKQGLIASLTGALERNMLARQYPQYCADGNGICGTDSRRAAVTMEALIPGLTWPPNEDTDDGVIFDLVEFFSSRVALAENDQWHSYMRHYELKFNEQAGQTSFRVEIDSMLRAGGTLFTLTGGNHIERIGTPEVHAALSDLQPNTGDQDLDLLILEARRLYRSPKSQDRQTGLEKLWDSFERLKTIEPGADKRAQAESLLRWVSSEPLREKVNDEMLTLTKVGNQFQIRHHETDKHPVPFPEGGDYLFSRLSTLIIFLLKVSNRLR